MVCYLVCAGALAGSVMAVGRNVVSHAAGVLASVDVRCRRLCSSGITEVVEVVLAQGDIPGLGSPCGWSRKIVSRNRLDW